LSLVRGEKNQESSEHDRGGIFPDEDLGRSRRIFSSVPGACMRKGITVGILAYAGCSAETLEDYCRFAFHLGRRNTEWDFFLGVRSKLEQFRARNSIVEAAIQTGSSYLLMLDDDHVIDWEGSAAANEKYDFLRRFVYMMEKDPKIGIIGALYFQRDSFHNPVIMKEGPDGKYFWAKEEDLSYQLQDVSVTGGGCMLLNMDIFNYIPSPWFEPELQFSTDIQICRKIAAAGFRVCCDTGTEIGHVKTQRTIISSKNREKATDHTTRVSDRISDDWAFTSMMTLYNMDIQEYTGKSFDELKQCAEEYQTKRDGIVTNRDNPLEYYRNMGVNQIARQWFYHNQVWYGTQMLFKEVQHVLNGNKLHALDFGCGTSPIGFELARQTYEVDFVDVPGSSALDFVKWRVKKREVETAGWTVQGSYDVVMLFDVIEHLKTWRDILSLILLHLKDGGAILTNYFAIKDWANPEHINMDQEAVKRWFVEHSIYPTDLIIWRKHGSISAESDRLEVSQLPGERIRV
jgi:2-polyprenyl-3-methyl-5-hydroxy-6-metoxy-1,4-benzoquinol methylase